MKPKHLVLMLIAGLMAGLTACRTKPVTETVNGWSEFDSVAPFFYSIVYDDFNFDEGRKIVNEKHMGGKSIFFPGGCSEVRYGNSVGRNLDWYVNNQAAAVLWLSECDGKNIDTVAHLLGRTHRCKSVGMVGANPMFTYPLPQSLDTLSSVFPLSMTDGVNENGVYIGVNVVPAGETTFDKDNWAFHRWGRGAAFTNPGITHRDSNAMCVTYLTRIVLNYANSVGDAVKIIDSLNWFEPYEIKGQDTLCQAFHWLICDSRKSAVVEFVDNKMQVVYDTMEPYQMYGRIMTNFSNSLYDKDSIVQCNGSGYERFNSLLAQYQNAQSLGLDERKALKQMMESVHFSTFYRKDKYKQFPTEFSSSKLYTADLLYPECKLDSDQLAEFHNKCDSICNEWKSPSELRQLRNDTSYWYSTHTCIYEISSDKSLEILIHEGYDESGYKKGEPLDKYYRKACLNEPGHVYSVLQDNH